METPFVCGSEGSTLTSMTLAHLNRPGLSNNVRSEQQRSRVSVVVIVCAVLSSGAVLFFFVKQPGNSSVPGTNGYNVMTPAKKTKPDQHRQPSGRRHVAKHVTVDQRVDKCGKCGGCFANVVGRRRIVNRTAASGASSPPHFMTRTVTSARSCGALCALASGNEDCVQQQNQRESFPTIRPTPLPWFLPIDPFPSHYAQIGGSCPTPETGGGGLY